MVLTLTTECVRDGCTTQFQQRSVTHKYCSPECLRWRPETQHQPYVYPSYIPKDLRGNRFIGVDGEGTGRGKDHKYVLLGVGDTQKEWPDGVQSFADLCAFLYGCYENNREAIYVGFFLGYDFNMWFRMLPRERASMLLTPTGIAKRARGSALGAQLGPFPVEYQGWEFDILAMKRFKLRPKGGREWMYICDAGPFFQCSLLSAINPKKWTEPIVTEEEYALIEEGKKRRDSAALDDDMRMYNRLENEIFSRLMKHLQTGLSHAGVDLKKQQWFGPGQAAQRWLRRVGTLEPSVKALKEYKKELTDAAIATYYGGWFEISVHGHVKGTTYEYDINSAYPYVASGLPCLCGKWRHGTGTPKIPFKYAEGNRIRMARVSVWGRDNHLGPLPYRRDDGRVLRPRYTEGYYWEHEIHAARRAGLIDQVTWHEYWEYEGCHHGPPLAQLNGLYESRLRIGKATPEGKAFKLVYNSVYGKFAQSEGEPVYGNPFYASLITAGCRTLILDAIATHPEKSSSVVMVATDGVYFTNPHPVLDNHLSERLGDWSREEHTNLCVFKPGVYWDDTARQDITEGKAPQFKSRGINAEDFSKSIADVDSLFASWGENWLPGMPPGRDNWPSVEFHARFTQVSVRQAIQWTEGIAQKQEDKPKQAAVYRKLAGLIQENKRLVQDSYPDTKRNPRSLYKDGDLWRSRPWDGGPHWPPSMPYDKKFGTDLDDTGGFAGFATPDGPAMLSFRQALGVG